MSVSRFGRIALSCVATLAVTGASFLAIDAPAVAAVKDAPDTSFGKGSVAYIDVATATVWDDPQAPRDVDAPAIANPVELREWTANMSLSQRRELMERTQTQVAYGQEVSILDTQGDWVEVAVPNQPSPKNDAGYPGWIPRAQLSDAAPTGQDGIAVISDATSWLYDDNSLSSKFMEISYDTVLPVISANDAAVEVATPSAGTKWISNDSAELYKSETDIEPPSGDELVADAKLFLDLPYLWAGTSGFGFDCSGLTYSLYQAHGITIPRDADVQQTSGTAVDLAEVQPGDLLFYGRDRVHHVGMYLGDGNMIDARTNSDTEEQTVEIVPVAEHPYVDEFAGAARYL